jgi:two-component system sensor histidine kinase KdpD
MTETRPDPDELLRQVKRAEELKQRGRLKIFLGASAGVGKTYAMLSEAHEQKRRGVDVVIGYIETHGRKETNDLVTGLDSIPLRNLSHRTISLKEFDLDSALLRHPQLVLVDELAHTNAPGSRHPKRYLDIEELLQAGINVYTAVNIQHLESLNDVVAQITGVIIRETVPDSFLEKADDVELIDIPPEELIDRLKEGKVYVPEQIAHALEGFFEKGNLLALRELALRRTADRVDAQMRSYRTEQGIRGLWATRERILVCIAPNRLATRLVRAAGRIAAASHAETIALYVESDRQEHRSVKQQENAREALRIAESLNMETVSLNGHDIVAEILNFARKRDISLIVVGKPIRPRWREYIFGSVVDGIVRQSGNIDVHIITGDLEAEKPRPELMQFQKFRLSSHLWTVVITALCTVICLFMSQYFELSNLIMIYLLGVAFVASSFGMLEAILISVLSVVSFDFFFVSPRFDFSVSDSQYLITFCVMLVVALLISSLTLRVRKHANASSERERRTASLYALTRELSSRNSLNDVCTVGAREIRNVFDCDVCVMAPEDGQPLAVRQSSLSKFESSAGEVAVAQWAYDHKDRAGAGTNTLPGASAQYLPLLGSYGAVGVLGVKFSDPNISKRLSHMVLLETFANAMASAIDRILLTQESQAARFEVETEKTRNLLLSSVSHDLRTPLTAISGAASILASRHPETGSEEGKLSRMIVKESERLHRHVRNLLDITRIESGGIKLNLEWNSIEELIGAALSHTEIQLERHAVKTNVAANLPLIKVDAVLAEKALVNIFENAARYSPEGSTIEVDVTRNEEYVRIAITDSGSGIPAEHEMKIFEKFYQSKKGSKEGGFGLGLPICKAIMDAHGGKIWMKSRSQGGTFFFLEFPIAENLSEVKFE